MAPSPRQLAFDVGVADTRLAAVDAAWENATEREKRSRTLYAQAALKPDEVAPSCARRPRPWVATRTWSGLCRHWGRGRAKLGSCGVQQVPK